MEKKIQLNVRQQAIQDLVKTHAIEDQGMLLELLKKEYKIETNQAVISRDLRSLGIFKRVRHGALVYELPQIDVMAEVLNYAVQSVERNETMIIIKTLPGTAGFVAEFLDTQDDFDLLGTLAGENTIFVVPRSIKTIEDLFQTICERFKIKE
jgi:transcriptional regulator of arginine metabolism